MATRKKKANKIYASRFEARVAKDLEGKNVGFKYEKTIIDYVKVHTYKPDFQLPNNIFIEVKGRFRPDDRKKHILVRKQHPELDIRFVFMRDNLLNPRSSTRYSTWCERHGFKYAIDCVPIEWIKEDGPAR